MDLKEPDIRYVNDMKKVLYDKQWAKTAPNLELYYMYRGVKQKGELRYDVTVIPFRMLGKELVKTKGHSHSDKFQELYTVLEGKAIFLFQKPSFQNKKEIEEVWAIKAREGEGVIVPPFCTHVTINPGKEELKVGNWISKKCKNIYGPIEKNGGACYFYTESGWIKNKNYKAVPQLRFKKTQKSLPKNLDFLKKGKSPKINNS